MAAECTDPVGGGSWTTSALDALNYSREDTAQDFVHGACDETAGYAITVWEYEAEDGTVRICGAWLDLTVSGATWEPVGALTTSALPGDFAGYPSVRVNPGGEFLLGYLYLRQGRGGLGSGSSTNPKYASVRACWVTP